MEIQRLNKENWKRFLLFVSILVSIIGSGVLNWTKHVSQVPAEEDGISKNTSLQEDEEIWNKYINSQLGFSMRIPKEVDVLFTCLSEKIFQVPVKVFEDIENGIVYISAEYYYETEWDSELETFTGLCEKVVYSLESIRSESEKRENKPFLGWTVLIRTVKNKDDLDKFIKEYYGSGCFAIGKIPWKQEGVYEISIRGENWARKGVDLENATCPLNYQYKVLYAPEKNKIMSINLGQECTFGTNPYSKSYRCYDEEMTSGFRFE